jgi:membrane-bound acyltransferase YfiQ involved in biofilm formation
MFIPYGAAAIICFLLGLLLDKRPKMRRPLMTLSNVAYSIGLLLVYFLPNVTGN